MWRVFVPPPGYLGNGGHRAFQGTTGLGHHCVVTEMEVQCLNNVCGIVLGTCVRKPNVVPGSILGMIRGWWNESFLSPSSSIFCASVQKAILGSSRWKRAHDLDRKLGPWKQARVMWLPWRLMEPPNWTASSGRGIWKRDMWQPAMTFRTPGQWRWCAASMSVMGHKVRSSWREQ